MPCYWDSSALLALIFKEPKTAPLRALAASGGGLPGYASFFAIIEMESAYMRRMAEGALAARDLPRLRLQAEKLEGALALLWPDAEVLQEARRVVLELGLRPADALQLATARTAAAREPGLTFVSLDAKLNQAAQACGLSLEASLG